MSLEEKISRYRKLKRLVNPSIKEFAEMEVLEEEIKLQIDDSIPEIKQQSKVQPNQALIIPQKKYHGIISGRIQAWRERRKEADKTTPEMLRQLQMDAQRAELEARIAVAKKKKKDNKTHRFDFQIPGKIFTETDERQYKSNKKKIAGSNDKDYSVLGI